MSRNTDRAAVAESQTPWEGAPFPSCHPFTSLVMNYNFPTAPLTGDEPRLRGGFQIQDPKLRQDVWHNTMRQPVSLLKRQEFLAFTLRQEPSLALDDGRPATTIP